MKKQVITRNFTQSLKLLKDNDFTTIYKTPDGEIVKLFSPDFIYFLNSVPNIDMENKLLNKEKYYISKEIVKPNTIYYYPNGLVAGYKMSQAIGTNFNDFDRLVPEASTDIERLSNIHKRLENIVKKNPNIVIPDLCSCDNIHIGKNDEIELIDYDGMQVGKYEAFQMSSTLEEHNNNYYIPKYCLHDNTFTKNLDKKSLILLYFLDLFHINLNTVGLISPFTKLPITLEEIFWLVGLKDNELLDKVSKIYNDKEENVYLEDTYEKIAKDYVYTNFNNNDIKRVKRK